MKKQIKQTIYCIWGYKNGNCIINNTEKQAVPLFISSSRNEIKEEISNFSDRYQIFISSFSEPNLKKKWNIFLKSNFPVNYRNCNIENKIKKINH